MGIQVCADTMENIQRFLRKLKIELPYDPSVPLLGIYPDKTKIKNIHMDLIKFISFCTAKEAINKMQRQPMDWEKILANTM